MRDLDLHASIPPRRCLRCDERGKQQMLQSRGIVVDILEGQRGIESLCQIPKLAAPIGFTRLKRIGCCSSEKPITPPSASDRRNLEALICYRIEAIGFANQSSISSCWLPKPIFDQALSIPNKISYKFFILPLGFFRLISYLPFSGSN
jgi:hypothetical protein